MTITMEKHCTRKLSTLAAPLIILLILLICSGSAAASHKSRSHAKESRGRRGESKSSKRDKRGRSRREYESRRRDKHGRSRREYESRRRGRHSRPHYYYASDAPAQSSGSQANSGIPAERVTEIQRALIKGGYLDGEPTGQYDSATIQAMKDFQSANGFSATGLPSASSLKKLGVARTSGDGYSVPINKAVDSDVRPVASPEVPNAKPAKPAAAQPKPQAAIAAPQASTAASQGTNGARTAGPSRPRTIAPAQQTDGKPLAKPDEKKPDEKKPDQDH
jgi:peptidoglycan hydrolase-like protein with peptidoglycan-binding domain